MKIYISATYRDLQKHREAVLAALRRMGHQPIGMEDYVAEGVRPLYRCLEDVKACDAYVGILAWRYGSVPKDAGAAQATLPKGTEIGKTSVTEFEYRQAVESKKERVMFLLDSGAEWPSTQMDAMSGEGEQGKAISRFREEIGQECLVSYFRTPEELASLVSAAVYRMEMRQISLETLRTEKFNEPLIRSGPVISSTLMEIKKVIAGPEEVRALQINIGQGFDWWVTRLYFLSSLAADLTSIEIMIFVGERDTFIGLSNPHIVKERLSQAYPMLKQYEDSLAQSGQVAAELPSEVERRATIWSSKMDSIGGEGSKTSMVTKRELENWLPTPYMITQAIEWDTRDNAALQIQRLLDWPYRFVPVIENGRFDGVIDKQKLSEQVTRMFVREQVSRALSMNR